MKFEPTEDYLYSFFTHKYNKSAQLGDEIECANTRYRLTQDGWIDVVKSSRAKKSFNEEISEVCDYMINLTKPDMEKQIKISLETARRMYNDVNLPNYLTTLILENFTTEELEDNKGYTWEESFNKAGYLIDGDRVILCTECSADKDYKDTFKTKEQAESALAFAQLSHIVSRANKDKKSGEAAYTIIASNLLAGKLGTHVVNYGSKLPHLVFFDEKDAVESLKFNRELWEKYWML